MKFIFYESDVPHWFAGRLNLQLSRTSASGDNERGIYLSVAATPLKWTALQTASPWSWIFQIWSNCCTVTVIFYTGVDFRSGECKRSKSESRLDCLLDPGDIRCNILESVGCSPVCTPKSLTSDGAGLSRDLAGDVSRLGWEGGRERVCRGGGNMTRAADGWGDCLELLSGVRDRRLARDDNEPESMIGGDDVRDQEVLDGGTSSRSQKSIKWTGLSVSRRFSLESGVMDLLEPDRCEGIGNIGLSVGDPTGRREPRGRVSISEKSFDVWNWLYLGDSLLRIPLSKAPESKESAIGLHDRSPRRHCFCLNTWLRCGGDISGMLELIGASVSRFIRPVYDSPVSTDSWPWSSALRCSSLHLSCFCLSSSRFFRASCIKNNFNIQSN